MITRARTHNATKNAIGECSLSHRQWMLVASMRSVQIAASPPAYGSRAARWTGNPTSACANACSDTQSEPGDVEGDGDGVRDTDGEGAADRLGLEVGVPTAVGEALTAARVGVPVRVAVAEGVDDAAAGTGARLGEGAVGEGGLWVACRSRAPLSLPPPNTSATALASS